MEKFSAIVCIIIIILSTVFVPTLCRSAPIPEQQSISGSSQSPSTTIDSFQEEAAAAATTTTPDVMFTENQTTSSTTTESPSAGPAELPEFISSKNTSTFSCHGRINGYYADVKLSCRVYHFCTRLDGLDEPIYQRMSYICLEDSYFDQKDLNCVNERELNVPCEQAEAEYERSNRQFDPSEESQPSYTDSLTANLMMNPFTRFIAGR